MATTRQSLEAFLQPLAIDIEKIHSLARSLSDTFLQLAAESQDQFLSTPLSESVLRPAGNDEGRYLAIDIGGTNLRAGFIELLGSGDDLPKKTASKINGQHQAETERSRVRRSLERSWPIGEQLKNDKAEDLFAWIGRRIAEVVRHGCQTWPTQLPDEVPLGVTFSFPMVQHTLADATLMPMGKGFAITTNLDLAKQLLTGYEQSRGQYLPRIRIAAIVNDAVATLVSFAYQRRSNPKQKAVMGLIVGTGCNATIPLAMSKLHPSKRPTNVEVLDGDNVDQDLKITVNTEWTINGAAAPLHYLNFITKWDKILDAEGEAPGFQPFEYMTAGRYLGELSRLMIIDYFSTELGIPTQHLPVKLRQRHGLSTTFVGNLNHRLSQVEPSMIKQLTKELPWERNPGRWCWNHETAGIVFNIAKAVEVRAAGLAAAAIIALLGCADEIVLSSSIDGGSASVRRKPDADELMVGYTGGCIVHFLDYLDDCQKFLDGIMQAEFGDGSKPRVVLQPCHDGGIIGAGILAGTVQNIAHEA